MTNYTSLWQDDYWILLMQLYQHKPAGMKPLYSRAMIDLCLELHLPPRFLYDRMFELRYAATPRLRQLWERYADSPRRLSKDAGKVRQMRGFCNGSAFYEGVETCESFEKDFRQLPRCGALTPVMLIMILDLYFRLTPITMNTETPEIQELAQLLKIKAANVVEVMDVFQILDPYLNRNEFMVTPLLKPCQEIWQRYGNGSIEELAMTAAQLKVYFQ